MAKNIVTYSPQVSKWRKVFCTLSALSEPRNLFIVYLETESLVQPI